MLWENMFYRKKIQILEDDITPVISILYEFREKPKKIIVFSYDSYVKDMFAKYANEIIIGNRNRIMDIFIEYRDKYENRERFSYLAKVLYRKLEPEMTQEEEEIRKKILDYSRATDNIEYYTSTMNERFFPNSYILEEELNKIYNKRIFKDKNILLREASPDEALYLDSLNFEELFIIFYKDNARVSFPENWRKYTTAFFVNCDVSRRETIIYEKCKDKIKEKRKEKYYFESGRASGLINFYYPLIYEEKTGRKNHT